MLTLAHYLITHTPPFHWHHWLHVTAHNPVPFTIRQRIPLHPPY